MTTSEALFEKAERYIRSAQLLAADGDFDQRQLGDYTTDAGLAREDINTLLADAQGFLVAAREWLARNH